MDKKVFDKKVAGFTTSIAKANANLVVLLTACFVVGDHAETERRITKVYRVIDGDAQQGRVLAWLNAYANNGTGGKDSARPIGKHTANDGQEYIRVAEGLVAEAFEHQVEAELFAVEHPNPMSWRGASANKETASFDAATYAATVAKRLLSNDVDALDAFIVALRAEVNKAKVANVKKVA